MSYPIHTEDLARQKHLQKKAEDEGENINLRDWKISWF